MTDHAPRAPSYAIHEAAKLFPLITGPEKDQFYASVAADGVRHPLVLIGSEILDGVNRYHAACAAGIPDSEIPVRMFGAFPTDGDDPLAFVLRENLHRRHLNPSQLAMVAADIATFKHGGVRGPKPAESGQDEGQAARVPLADHIGEVVADAPNTVEGVNQALAAELVGVSERSVRSAAAVKQAGVPELQDAVRGGTVSVKAAEQISTLPADLQKEIVARGEKEILEQAARIRKDKADIRRRERIGIIRDIASGNTPLSTEVKYPVIYADPPTKFAAGDTDRSAENHYPTMTEEEITALPIGALAADDAVLFIWTTEPWLRKTLRMIEAWGFEYKSSYVWDKVDIGTGYWCRNQHETLLVCTRGDIPSPPRSSLYPSIERSKKREHSRKPDFYFRMIGEYYPDLPKIVLFHRGPAPMGWSAWGNQVEQPADDCDVIEKLKASEPAAPTLAEAALDAIEKHKCGAGCKPDPAGDDAIDNNLDIPGFLRRQPAAPAA